jgi:S1-C subfamily serine protease
MNFFDFMLISLGIAAAVGGYRLGFLTRAISWLGLALGIVLAVAILPGLIGRVDDGSGQTMMVLVIATLLGCALVGQGIGLALGSRLHIALPQGTSRQVDQSAGGTLGVIGVLVGLWLLLPTLAVSTMTADQVRGSTISQWVYDYSPDVPESVQDLRRVVGESFPEVFDAMTPAPDPGPPPAESGISAELDEQVRHSTVKVHGVACNRIQEGSGWVVAEDLIVTNAHVVAGERETQVLLQDGSERDALVVAYDAHRDLVVLRVDGLGLPALNMQDAEVGDIGAVYGYPGGGDLTRSPFEVGDKINAVGTDIYDRSRSERQVLVLASDLNPGDSGAALVDSSGDVIGVAFAIAPDRSGVAYALDLSELRAVFQGDLVDEVDTGACLV